MSRSSLKLMTVGENLEGAWDLSYAYYDPPVVSTESPEPNQYIDNANTSTNGTATRGFYIRPDGLGWYKADNNNNRVYQYESVIIPWTLGYYVRDAPIINPYGIAFKSDGTQFYAINQSGNQVNMRQLSVAWDISTVGGIVSTLFTSTSFGITSPDDLQFSADGTRLYIATGSASYEIALSTAWDITTGTLTQSVADSRIAQAGFRSDGTRALYAQGSGASQTLIEFSFSTPWDISTASEFNTVTTTGVTTNTFGRFRPDGKMGFSNVGGANEQFRSFTFGALYVDGQDDQTSGLAISPDGTKLYTAGELNDSVYQYDIVIPWDLSTATYTQALPLSGSERSPSAISFKTDGTKMYVSGTALTGVSEYALSTPWDVLTAVYTTTFDTSSQIPDGMGLTFKPDGSVMFVSGSLAGTGEIFAYTLSTPWDVSSATLSTSFYPGVNLPAGLAFKPSGDKMFVVRRGSNTVQEFALSTAWDVSTASLTTTYNASAYISYSADIAFRSDGTAFYLLSGQTFVFNNVVATFSLGVEE